MDMCFSATASFTAGAALTVTGGLTLRKSQGKLELPLALVPLLFGVQQLTEGALWLSLRHDLPLLQTWTTNIYSMFSHVLWPIFVPFAILLVETKRRRRVALGMFQALGLAVGLYLLYFLVRLPIISQAEGRHIAYLSPHFYLTAVMVLYVLGTCVSMLVSSHRRVRLFGLAAFIAYVVTYVFYRAWVISVWCFFAAVLSVIVLLYFPRRPASPSMVAQPG